MIGFLEVVSFIGFGLYLLMLYKERQWGRSTESTPIDRLVSLVHRRPLGDVTEERVGRTTADEAHRWLSSRRRWFLGRHDR